MEYFSIYDLKREITDYQLSLLICLKENHRIVTNEGNYFRAWLETEEGEIKKLPVRKDVADKMLSHGLITLIEGRVRSLYYYTISPKAEEVIDLLDSARLNLVKNRMLRKGILQKKSS